jgi:hypothetical protein
MKMKSKFKPKIGEVYIGIKDSPWTVKDVCILLVSYEPKRAALAYFHFYDFRIKAMGEIPEWYMEEYLRKI